MVSLIGHHLTMMELSTDYHRAECNPLIEEFSTVSKQWKHLARLQDQMQYLQRSTKQEVLQLQRNWQLFHIMWRKAAIPQEFKDATIIHLFKRKGDPQVCDNHRGICLLSTDGKIFANVLLNRLNEHHEQSGLLLESQCGFRKDRNNQHDLHSKTASREMPGTECGPLHIPCRPYQSIWHSQSWGTLEKYGKVWLSCQIHSSGVAVPQWYACKGPKWWRVFWSIPSVKWS